MKLSSFTNIKLLKFLQKFLTAILTKLNLKTSITGYSAFQGVDMRHRNLIIAVLITLMPSALFAATVPLPSTGQNSCHDSAGKEIVCTGTGQDGEQKFGIAIPSRRLVDNGNGTVTDSLTGLIWLKNADCFGSMTWQQAIDSAKSLSNGKCGLTDRSTTGKWRIPNIVELESIADLNQHKPALPTNHPFTNVQISYYWSSTTKADEPVNAWYLYTLQGAAGYAGKYTIKGGVWPVKDGTVSGKIKLPATGQAKCYDEIGTAVDCSGTGQDGELKTGVAWPVPRFKANSNLTITDNLTGLIWSQEANSPGPASCAAEKYMTWQEALEYVACLNRERYLGFSDWRLPNRKEMGSLTNMGEADNGAWLRAHGFTKAEQNIYWTSTNSAQRFSYGWSSSAGLMSTPSKSSVYNVWPVRGGVKK